MKVSKKRPLCEEAPEDAANQARLFAQDCLGPASEHLLSSPASQARILSRLRRGLELEDAVLAEVFSTAATDRLLADEFVAYFLSDILRIAHGRISPGLRQYLDTGDLVDSVLGKLWVDLRKISFKDRASFLAYLACGLGWKAAGQARKWKVKPTGEERSVSLSSDDMATLAGSYSKPDSIVAAKEERDRLILTLPRLRQQDRLILNMHFQGHSREKIAKSLGIKTASVRDALSRAVQQARKLS